MLRYSVSGVSPCYVVAPFSCRASNGLETFSLYPMPPPNRCLCTESLVSRHHKYPFDYAASEFGIGSQFNPTKLFIDSLAAIGLVTNRKRATGAWAKLKERRDKEESEAVATKAVAGGVDAKKSQ